MNLHTSKMRKHSGTTEDVAWNMPLTFLGVGAERVDDLEWREKEEWTRGGGVLLGICTMKEDDDEWRMD